MTINSAKNGLWHAADTWVGGVVPSPTDEVHTLHQLQIVDSRTLESGGKIFVDAPTLAVDTGGVLTMLGGELTVGLSGMFDTANGGRTDMRGGVWIANGNMDISVAPAAMNVYGGEMTWLGEASICGGARLNIYGGTVNWLTDGGFMGFSSGSSLHMHGGAFVLGETTYFLVDGLSSLNFYRREATIKSAGDGHSIIGFQNAYGMASRPQVIGAS